MTNELNHKKEKNKLERVIIDPDTKISIQNLIDQIENELGDAVSITPKILINFLLRERAQKLNSEELNKLKNQNFDLVKAMKKATDEVIKAKIDGRHIELNDIVRLIQTPSVMAKTTSPNKRGRKKKENSQPATQQNLDTLKNENIANSAAKNSEDQKQMTDSNSTQNQNNLSLKSS